MRRTAGYLLFAFSFAVFGLIALLPFTELSAGAASMAAGALFIGGEVAFWLSLLLLGKEFWGRIKSWFSNTFKTKD